MTTPRRLTPYERTQLARYGSLETADAVPADIPIEYVTGKVEFSSQVFDITPAALIPRLETEELVRLAAQELKHLLATRLVSTPLIVADVGTGCGAIIISLASQFTKARVPIHWYASEISPEALELAQRNAQTLLGTEPEIQWLQSDLLASYPAELKLDLLVANLPYIPHERIAYLDASVRQFEPHTALDGGPDGLTLIKNFIQQATTRTTPGSVILLEIDYTHTATDFSEFGPDWLVSVHTDSLTRNRFARLERRSAVH